ncbi:hypothetical protein B9Q08_02470 [Candidatus Marsarchaeota G2 archaeon ECH_B_SAG-M15]|uniref:Archaeal Type IV pilin N-terminal domain-containing protein n=1 Tax=Candidatus Marsarchaeota G2 archaeon ECH_B_SAG-M15 TaxID=1978162 RepID=A0A2R6AZD9_9ARCH|nr:MAG: hypothetical protein B9Q08_02470 [Candidatus Marsarchaeota G2 archaeon ECH_B_SAG-M15]
MRSQASRSGVSPVIASIVLIAIAVVIAVALSGWAFGLSKSYMRADGVTILPSESSCSLSGGCRIVVSNQGDSPISVVRVLANSQDVSQYTLNPAPSGGYTIPAHTQAIVVFGLTGISVSSTQQNIEVQIGLSNGNTVSTVVPVTS